MDQVHEMYGSFLLQNILKWKAKAERLDDVIADSADRLATANAWLSDPSIPEHAKIAAVNCKAAATITLKLAKGDK